MEGYSNTDVCLVREASSLDPGLLSTGKLVVSGAEACWLIDTQGKRYFDGSGGSGAVNLGHQHPQVVAAILEQATRLLHTGWNLQSDVRTEAVNRLGEFSPYESCSVLLTVTGAEAIEAAIKIARAYTRRQPMIAFERSYHGKTAGSLAVTWRESFKRFSSDSSDTVFVPFPMLHREEEEAQPQFCLEQLEAIVSDLDREGRLPAAFIIEPIQGAEGVFPAGSAFMNGIMKVAKRIGSLIIYDEIYTGFGRCGSPFHGSRKGLRPDLMVVGKALGNGLPISAVVGPAEILEALPPGHHTSTFAGNPLCCAAACAVLEVMNAQRPWLLAEETGARISTAVLDLSRSYPFISKPRGEGMMLAFDCKDLSGKPSPAFTSALAQEALLQGVVLRYGGFQESTIKITPPLLMTSSDTDFFLEALFRAVAAVADRKDGNALQ